MGGCCCSSRKYQLRGAPVYYYIPPALEDRESLTFHSPAVTAGFLIDLNLDTSTPDTYRPPPPPIPFDMVFGFPQSTDSEPADHLCSGNGCGKAVCLNLKESDCETENETFIASPRKFGVEFQKLNVSKMSTMEEEDCCPTCFEDYDAQNPKITTKCGHHFHLSCILEWMERSGTCPICNQEMKFDARR